MAEILHKHRKSVDSHKVVTRKDLYEIRATKMICLYDELFFHDNAEDCAWFHGGGMQQMAEETVAALCAMLGITYVPMPQEKTDRLYRVQVGAYAQKSNATAMVQRLKEAGFEAIIV